MKKEPTNRPLYAEELEQLNFDQAEQEARELFEQETLPTPSQLEKYNTLVPNGAERILNLIEEERAHRRKAELKQIKGSVVNNNLMVIFGFVLGFFLIVEIGSGSGMISYFVVWVIMLIILIMVLGPFIKSRLGR